VSLRRGDVRFLLPRLPERALVLGDLDGWREALAGAMVEVVPGDDRRTPELAVAPAALAGRALASGAEMVVLEGAAPRALARSGLALARLLPRPSLEEPSLLVPVDDPVVSAYAVDHWSVVDRRWKAVRARGARALLRRGSFPNLSSLVTLAVGRPGPPFMVAEAEDRLGLPKGTRSLLALGQGDVLSRNVFHLFPPGGTAPEWILKFARVGGYVEPFERDERGLAIAARSGGRVAARAPRLLGRLELDGIHGSLETAADGHRLRDLLLRPGPRRPKLRLIDAVAGWILDVARETAAPPEALADERRRLEEEVLPHWTKLGAAGDLVARLPSLPAVVQHNDLGSWNVVVGPAGFTAVDWESARERALPLWDLCYFLADALAVLDGSTNGSLRHLHTTRLFRGELASSGVLFRWLRAAVAELELPPASVGPVVTLCWLHHALSPVARRAAIGSFARGAAQPTHGTENVAAAWLSDPALGERWDRWLR
jgi:hypothetical protein